MHENSLSAYASEHKKLNKRESKVMDAVSQMGYCTDRMVKDHLKYDEMNSVRPRISELLKKEILEEAGVAKCNVTGQTVRIVRIKPSEGFAQEFQQNDLFHEQNLNYGV